MLNDQSTPPAPSHDAIKLLSDLLALVASPAAAKKVVDDLLAASVKHKAVVDAAKAEQGKLTDLRADVEAGVAELRTSTAARLSADQSAFDKRVAEQTNALAAREARAASLEQKAVEHEAASAKMRAVLDAKMKVLSA